MDKNMQLVSQREVTRRLGVGPAMAKALLDAGVLPYVQVSRMRLVSEQALEDLQTSLQCNPEKLQALTP